MPLCSTSRAANFMYCKHPSPRLASPRLTSPVPPLHLRFPRPLIIAHRSSLVLLPGQVQLQAMDSNGQPIGGMDGQPLFIFDTQSQSLAGTVPVGDLCLGMQIAIYSDGSHALLCVDFTFNCNTPSQSHLTPPGAPSRYSFLSIGWCWCRFGVDR
jgi:hypothetical protein